MVCASIGHGAWRMVQHIGRKSAWCRSWRYRVGHGSVTAWRMGHGVWRYRMGWGIGHGPSYGMGYQAWGMGWGGIGHGAWRYRMAHGAWYRAWRMGHGVGYIPLVYLT